MGPGKNQINNALEIIYFIGVGRDLAWRDVKELFHRIFVSNDQKFVETVKDCWRTELNPQQLFEIIYELIRLKSPPSSQKTQRIAITIFAPLAFFAVRFPCYSNGSQDADFKGLQKNNIAKLISQNFQQICVHLGSSAVFSMKFGTLILGKELGTCSYWE